jgi:pescadillo protein
MKKIKKAAGRNQVDEARRKDRLKPKMVLDHLVKERYPRFIDALRDMDDALCMIHLFASLPSQGRITAEKTSKCRELVRHWQYYIAKSRTLQKSFVSVKGVYFQAEVMGEPITWLVPHQFTQAIPKEVDLRVMLTFLEFYEVFMKFVLFKLYHMQGVRYPPTIDKNLNDAGCCLLSVKASPVETNPELANSPTTVTAPRIADASSGITVAEKKTTKGKRNMSSEQMASLNEKIAQIEEDDEEDDDEEDNVPIAGPLDDAFKMLHGEDAGEDEGDDEERKTFAADSDKSQSQLFGKLKFFVNREVPLEWLQLCTLSFGAQIGWDGLMSPFDSKDPGITHHVVDKPMQGASDLSREYIQPQWVFDSINAQMLLPAQNYRPGEKLPPHLSPFVDDEKVGYMPRYREELKKLKAAAQGEATTEDAAGADSTDGADDDEEDEEEYMGSKAKGKNSKERMAEKEEIDDDEDDDDEDEESDDDDDDDSTDGRRGKIDKLTAGGKKGTKGVVFKPQEAHSNEVSLEI